MSIGKRNWVPVLAIGLVSGLLASSVGAHPGDRITKQLDLTEAQRQSLAEIRAELRTSRESAQTRREQVVALVKGGNVDGAAALAAEQARERVYRRAEMRRRVSEVLTAEQLKEMEALRMERPAKHEMGRRHAGRRGSAEEVFSRMDANGDGFIGKEEFLSKRRGGRRD